MRRRDFITGIATCSVWPLAARAQQSDQHRLIGVLMGLGESNKFGHSLFEAFRDVLANLGWTEGNNLQIALRWGAGDKDSNSAFAKELVGLRPNALLAHTTPVIDALARETKTIPIVFAVVSDPIGGGFAASLAHPGGNVTGFTNVESTLGGKWVALLKEIAPHTTRVALLFNPATTVTLQFFLPSIQAAATSFAVQASAAPVHTTDEIERIVALQTSPPGGGLIVLPDSFNTTNRDLIIALAASYGVPAIYDNPIFIEAGGLISYGADRIEQFRQAASYIDRIFRGTKPADLPIQQPTRFELVINLKSAKMLGLTVPLALQASADKVID